jgi:hypothetical protein
MIFVNISIRGKNTTSAIHGSFCAALSKRHCDKRLVITFNTSVKKINCLFMYAVLKIDFLLVFVENNYF